MFAAFAFDRLQPVLEPAGNIKLTPSVLVQHLVLSEGFIEVAHQVESRGNLIWSVKQGAKPGIYTNTYVYLIYEILFISQIFTTDLKL